MKVCKTRGEIADIVRGKSVGFIPTMGALHHGHIQLVKESVSRNLFTVVSIFVNPTQFNNPDDFEKYPVDVENDLRQLSESGCDAVFLPSQSVVYEPNQQGNYIHDFGRLEVIYEGQFRPGHFKGVGQVVHILFEFIQPVYAFFGEKDFQQLHVVKKLVELTHMNTTVIGIETVREKDGLAMSSRNRRLSHQARSKANSIYKALRYCIENYDQIDLKELIGTAKTRFLSDSDFTIEYLNIIDERDFNPVTPSTPKHHMRVIIAVWLDGVRLIDNLPFKSKESNIT